MTAPTTNRTRAQARRYLRILAVRLTLYAVALFGLYAAAPLGRRKDAGIVVELVLALAVLTAVVTWQIRAIIRSPFPRLQAVQAVAVSIPLLIVTFATTYVELAEVSPHSFSEPVGRVDGVYFTVTVLATVGFGDIAPVTDAARMIVTGQMVADLILVGFIAKVIFNTVEQRRRALGDPAPEPDPIDEVIPPG